MLSSNSLTSPECLSCTGTDPCVFVRFPGASSESDIQLRPSTGSSDICFGSIVALTHHVGVARGGDCGVTVTDSGTVDGANWRLTTAAGPTSSSTLRITV